MKIDYPVKYDPINLSVNDANGRVLAQLSWPKSVRPTEHIEMIGRKIADSLNSVNDRMVHQNHIFA